MNIQWWRLLVMMLLSFGAEGYYHLRSLQRFTQPKNSSSDSLFGYSIAYQQTTKRLVISAPNNSIGKIYECNIENTQCLEFVNTVKDDYVSMFEDHRMWLGATVATGQNFTVACAPRYMENRNKTGTFGQCFVAIPPSNNMTEMLKISDKDKEKVFTSLGSSYAYEYYMDSFGWSIDVTRNGAVVVGGPAMYKGRVIEYSGVKSYPKLYDIAMDKSKDPLWEISYNFGYSVASGNFKSSKKDDIVYAVGSTYGRVGIGQVLLHDGKKTWPLLHPQFNSPRMGSLFGATMSAATLSRKNPQILLVGAPAYTTAGQDQTDVGAVYIYSYDNSKKAMMSHNTILGGVNGGRFGSAIVSLGDLDGDNMDEIAISAPYENTGMVYIYSGTQLMGKHLTPKHMQKISPSPGHHTFGLSLAALQDYDENGCNELAIGAPESNAVVLLRCMATITVKVNKLQEKVELPTFPRARRNDTYFVFQSCLDITYPEKPAKISAEIQVRVSIQHATASLSTSAGGSSQTYLLSLHDRSQKNPCVDVGIIMPEVGRDRNILYEISVTQLNDPRDSEKFDVSRLYLSSLSSLLFRGNLWVADCEGRVECNPKFEDLSLNTTIAANYIIGSTGTEIMRARTLNMGDMAYSACAHVRVTGVQLQRTPATCVHSNTQTDLLECEPRMPVKKNTYWEIEDIELDMKSLKSNADKITFKVDIFPECSKTSALSKELSVKLQPDTRPIVVRGSTNIGDLVELTKEDITDTGKQMSHDYTVTNYGVTDWVNIKVEITIKMQDFINIFELNVESVPYECGPMETKGGDKIVSCSIAELKKKQTFAVILPMYIQPKKIDEKRLRSNLTVSSHLKLIYGNYEAQKSVGSILKFKSGLVPLWIIIVAVFVGLLIICILVFALHECGCLRRKNKDKLRNLKHRQSIRQSQIRESMRIASQRSSEKEKIVEESSENENAIDRFPENPSENDFIREVPNRQNSVEMEQLEENLKKRTTMPAQRRQSHTTNDEKSLLKTIEDDDDCKIKNKDQIIRGLQKNLVHRSNQFLAPTKGKNNE